VTRLLWIIDRRLTRLVILAVNLGLALASLGLWIVALQKGLSWRADFTMLYTGASIVGEGLCDRLYDLGVQAAIQQQILGGRHLAGGVLPFNYPPYLALLLVPLARLSLDQAYLVWSALQVAALGLAGWILCRHLKAEGINVRTRYVALAAVAALPFVGTALLLGALSNLMLLGWLGYALAVRRGRNGWAAFWVLVMTLKPQVAVVPALVLLASRRWRAVGLVVGFGLGIALITCLALGCDVWPGFLEMLTSSFGGDASLGIVPGDMVNLRGFLVSLLGEGSMEAVSVISVFAFVLSLLVVIWLWSGAESDRADFDLRMAFSLLLGLLFSLHGYPQDAVLLVVPVLLFWHYLVRVGRHVRMLGIIASICPALFWVTERFLSAAVLGLRMPAVAMLVLTVWMLGEAGFHIAPSASTGSPRSSSTTSRAHPSCAQNGAAPRSSGSDSLK